MRGRLTRGLRPSFINFFPLNNGKGIQGMGLAEEKLKVRCYSGRTYAERPVSFLWQGTEYDILEIEKAGWSPASGTSRCAPPITSASTSGMTKPRQSGRLSR